MMWHDLISDLIRHRRREAYLSNVSHKREDRFSESEITALTSNDFIFKVGYSVSTGENVRSFQVFRARSLTSD